jgi:hypothetical protein
LLAAFSLIAVALYWLRKRLDAAVIQAEAVRKLEAVGASINYRHEWDYSRNRFSGNPPPGGTFLRSILGDHFFLIPDTIILDSFSGESSALAPLGKLSTVTALGLTESAIGDDVLPIVARISALEELSLYGTEITDEGLLTLAVLPNLRNLTVTNTRVTSKEVARFRTIRPQCQVFNEDVVDEDSQ